MSAPASSAEKRTVLVMDDNAAVLKLAAIKLEQGSYAVDAVRSLDELLAAIGRRKPDVALIDVNMPEIFGYDLVDYLREKLQIKAPVLLFSSLDEVNLQSYVSRYRADGYIQKSVGLFTIAEQMDRFFSLPR